MSWIAVKALFFRYVYMLRHKLWESVFLVGIIALSFYSFLLLESKFPIVYEAKHKDIERHDEQSLTVIPWQLQIVVYPDGSKERQLLEHAQTILRLQFASSIQPLKITYVNSKKAMIRRLVSWRSAGLAISSRGLHFHEITNTKLEYTIRPQVPNTSADLVPYRTSEKFPYPMDRGPQGHNPYFGVYSYGMIYTPGIMQLQVAIDKAYIETHVSNNTLKWQLLSFPYPTYYDLDTLPKAIYKIRLIFFQIILPFTLFLIFGRLYSNIITDKVSGIRELLSINGAPRWMVNTSWLIASWIEATILAVVEILIFKSQTTIFDYMSESVLTIVLFALNWSSICWVGLISSIFTNEMLCSILLSVWGLTPILFLLIPPDRFVLHGLLAILPNAGFVLMIKAFQEFDGAETELGLTHVFSSPTHYLSVGMILVVMIVTMIIILILIFYVDLVKPGPFGRAMPWYIFTQKEKSRAWPTDASADRDDIYFEGIDSKDPIGLECVNIDKFFGKHKAVDNVSMKILKNRITVLLGHNGAGKSTLFSILCGMYSPTRGHFYTEHYNVFENDNIKRFRKALGYCPQSNLLMDELTVNQHLVVFALLKGLSLQAARAYSDKWTALFEMEETRETKAKKLSGGTKRKLSLAIAMIGDPEYLLLDEPSSGLDPESIKKFWNMMLREKGKWTAVLSTHNMDEAETLGDRMAFMGSGQLKAYGSKSFLRMKLETGYKLSCATDEKELRKLIEAVRRITPSATIMHRTNRNVTFTLPSDKSKYMPNLMKSLDSEFGNKIALSLSQSTMDDVFIKHLKRETIVNLEDLVSQETEIDQPQYFTFGQLKELFKKRMKWLLYRRLIVMIIVVHGLPALGMIVGMYIMNEVYRRLGFSETNFEDLKLTLDEYSGYSALISIGHGDVGGPLKLALRSSGIHYEEMDDSMINALEEKAKRDLFHYRSKIVFAFEYLLEPIAYYSRNALHSAPIAYSAMINALLQGKATIDTHNHPLVQEFEGCSWLLKVAPLLPYLMVAMLLPMLSIAVSYFVFFPHQERQSLFKHIQLMTGLLPITYWISNLIFDMAVFLSSCILLLVILAVMDNGLFFNPTVTGAIIVVLILYGFSAILFAYVWSFFWCTTPRAVYWYFTFNTAITSLYLSLETSLAYVWIFSGIKWLYFIPMATLLISFQKIARWAGIRRNCYTCNTKIACEQIESDPLFSQLKKELMSFACVSLVYFGVVLALDHGLGRRLVPVIRQGFCKGGYGKTKGETVPEVAEEKRRVKNLEMVQTFAQPGLVSDDLGKIYSCDVVAVRDVTFATELGELFGLLGANGAGKTTTFGILAGLISPTKGDAIIGGQWRLGDCEYKYIKNIGYCPQFEGLLPGLSSRTTLHLIGRFRRVKLDELDSHVDQWLEALDMTSLADRPCEQYSGGNKRKLSLAVAMIGSPPVVLLDEPTTGIDPIIRKRIWEILMLSLKQHKQAIVLTSHTMSECEAICDRLTILVKGEMKCLGPVPKLKNTYGKSCTLQVKLSSSITSPEIDAIQSQISSKFAGHIKLLEKQVNILIFNVETKEMKVYDVLAVMIKIKEANSAIEDFSLTETPLEDIFLMFAQGPGKKGR